MSSMPYIQVKNLYKVFGDKPQQAIDALQSGQDKDTILKEQGQTVGLNDINLSINAGEIFVIMGLSGSGKSTLIRHFNRLIDPDSGEIMVEGVDVCSLNTKQLRSLRQHKMSMVFQRFGLLPHKTVIENIGYGLKVQKLPKHDIEEKAQYWLDTVGLQGYANHYPSQLSGGQQQRVGLARALCTDADILLMDEAFSALDPLIRSEMQDQLIALQHKLNKTIIFITHDLDEALRLGDKIAILKDGKLVQQGKPAEILLNPANEYVEAFVKDVNRARALTVETVMQPQIVRISSKTIGEAVIEMRKIPQGYGYYIDENGYQGVLTKTQLDNVDVANYPDAVNTLKLSIVPAIQGDRPLEEVLKHAFDTDLPLPVLGQEGRVEGTISRAVLANIFK